MTLSRHPRRRTTRRGAMLVLIAVCLPLCIMMAAFAVDVAWMQLARTQLRTSTDAAARAGAKGLSLFQDTKKAEACAMEAATRNVVAGQPLMLKSANIEFGSATRANEAARFLFTAGGARPNAVRVTGDRSNGSLNGAVDLLFAGVLGVKTFQPIDTATATVLDRDICLVVDRSGSMMWTLYDSNLPPGSPNCGPPHPTLSRWGSLAIAVEAFLVQLEKSTQVEHVGLVSYSSDKKECGYTYKISTIDSTLVGNYSPIRNAMTAMSSKPVKGNTAISAGIDDGIKVLTGSTVRPFALRTMILLTDGIHNTGPEPVLSARNAAKKDIVIHTITFSKDADIKRMQDVAAATGGKHYHADDQQTLIEIFKELAAIPVLLTD